MYTSTKTLFDHKVAPDLIDAFLYLQTELEIGGRLIMNNNKTKFDVPELKSSEAGGCTLGLTGGGCLTAPPPGRPRLPSAPLPICDI